jgi:hypothetical protein
MADKRCKEEKKNPTHPISLFSEKCKLSANKKEKLCKPQKS